MRKELKEKFTAYINSLYNEEWVVKAADEGYEDFLEIFNGSIEKPELRIAKDNYRFAMIYYGAFEHALNTFIRQALQDQINKWELDIRDLENIMAKLVKR
jgi:hypothetical protein